jgi:two-component system response regulator NreC
MNELTLILADPHHLVRQGLCLLLDAESDFKVIGETGNGLEVIELVEKLRPHVLVLELMLPDLGGQEVIRRIRRQCPQAQVLVLSIYDDVALVREALRNGATGYVLKASHAAVLAQAIRAVARGQRYLSPPLPERLINAFVQQSEASAFDPYEDLSDREREVLQMVVQGQGSREIADKLGLSPRTVENHRASLMRKLNLTSLVELMRYAMRHDLVR